MCYVKCLEKGYDLADRPSQSILSSVKKHWSEVEETGKSQHA